MPYSAMIIQTLKQSQSDRGQTAYLYNINLIRH